MKLSEALEIAHNQSHLGSDRLSVFLVCGFNPLHLETLLTAELRLLRPGCPTKVETGLYGDLIGNLERAAVSHQDVAALVFEWSDLDPRLGIRSLGRWRPDVFDDILDTVKSRLRQLELTVKEASARRPFIICPPTLPLPPVEFTPGWQGATLQFEPKANLYASLSRMLRCPNLRVVSMQRLDLLSPLAERFDAKSEIALGFPYKLPHASAVARLLALLINSPTSKKGLISDLDNTLWRGTLGEVGVQGVSWDPGQPGHIHGLYQRLLDSLSAEGVLIGIVSKNEPSLVEEAFKRGDLLLNRDSVYPIEAGWGSKSTSVERVLEVWNVAADSIVFVDDSPAELAEVRSRYPEMECLLFPAHDVRAAYGLMERLRDLFGKSTLLEEDKIRLESIRGAIRARKQVQGDTAYADEFFAQANPEIQLLWRNSTDPRVVELVNKTNQFNLNGKRRSQAYWIDYLKHPGAFLLTASYRDKYGPLGKIAVLAGRKGERVLLVETWVMSCRAFGRRIEHKCVEALFSQFEVDEIEFDFQASTRNQVFCQSFVEMFGNNAQPACRIRKDQFLARFAHPKVTSNTTANDRYSKTLD